MNHFKRIKNHFKHTRIILSSNIISFFKNLEEIHVNKPVENAKFFWKKRCKRYENRHLLKLSNFSFYSTIYQLTEELKEQNKVLRGAQCDLDRDKYQMDREKKRLEI